MNEQIHKVTRSSGIPVSGYIVGGGYSGLNQMLDDLIVKEAAFLRDHFNADVTIRFNSDRLSGGAWLVDSPEESLFSNSSIGLGASLYNSKLRNMQFEERMNLAHSQVRQLIQKPDSISFSTHIDLQKAEHSVDPDSKYILLNTEHRDFDSLEEAVIYLTDHVSGLKIQR